MKDYMQYNNFNLNNLDINNITKIILIISFIIQWSLISMIINLFTLGLFTVPVFLIFILDAISMLVIKNKTILKPSFILSKLWDLIGIIFHTQTQNSQNPTDILFKLSQISNKISDKLTQIKNKISNVLNSIVSIHTEDKKYKKSRNINKFSKEVGDTVIVESISYGKLDKKSFKYRDRTQSYIHMLEVNGYKDYSKYNINPKEGKCYLIRNKKKDIIDIENNKIQISHDHKNYKFITDGWNNN